MIFKILAKREKIILFTTIGVIIFSFIFNFVIMPLVNMNNTLNKEIRMARMKLAKSLWLLSQKDNIQNKYSSFVSSGNTSDEQKDSTLNVLSEIEGLAKDARVRIIDIRPQVTYPSAKGQLLVDLRCQGTMDEYLKFIYNLENSNLLLNINRYQLSVSSANQLIDGIFTISKFSLPD